MDDVNYTHTFISTVEPHLSAPLPSGCSDYPASKSAVFQLKCLMQTLDIMQLKHVILQEVTDYSFSGKTEYFPCNFI